MKNDSANPDVLVLGMPSCGKTVFFTVLGKKFTSLVDGRGAAPLGFRMSTCDQPTADTVEEEFDRMVSGKWPKPTDPGQVMPLRWEVSTGSRRIFELHSMDLAGEAFRKVFGIEDKKTSVNEKSPKSIANSKRKKADDDEIYLGETSSYEDGQESLSTEAEQAVESLKSALKTAKAVCFMINIALPDRRAVRELSEEDETKLRRFRNSVINIYLSLKGQPELQKKTIILLTQTYGHEGEIERAGGPAMYLADVGHGAAAELCNTVREAKIPVLAVSAINVESDANELPEINSPSDIKSSGLFGFLLMVAGTVADRDPIAKVKNAYRDYLHNKIEYLKLPARNINQRLGLARRYNAAATAYVKACEDYLADIANLQRGNNASPLSLDAQRIYREYTLNDPEVKEAREREYLVRDELWDRALRRAVVAEMRGAGVPSTDGIFAEVRAGLLREFSGKYGNPAFVYGFNEVDLSSSGGNRKFKDWVAGNVDEYKGKLRSSIDGLDESREKFVEAVDTLEASVGMEGYFDTALSQAEKMYEGFSGVMLEFRTKWLDDKDSALPAVDVIERDVDEKYRRVSECKREHERLRKAKVSARRRRKALLALLILLAIGAVTAALTRYAYDEGNKKIARDIRQAVIRSNYAHAGSLYDSMYTVKWLGIHPEDYLCPNFRERLSLAEKENKLRKSVDDYYSKLLSLNEWLTKNVAAAPDGMDEEIGKAQKECVSALGSCNALPPSLSLNDFLREGFDIGARISAFLACESALTNSIEVITKMKAGWDERQRKATFIKKREEAEGLLKKFDSGIDSLDKAAIADHIVKIDRWVGELKKLSGADATDAKDAAAFEKDANAVKGKLQVRHQKLLDEERQAIILAGRAKIQAAKTLIAGISKEADGLDEKGIADRTKKVLESLRNVVEQVGTNEALAVEVEGLKKDADSLRKKLQSCADELKKKKFNGIVAAVRVSIASNSLEEAWRKYDAVQGTAKDKDEVNAVASLRKDLENMSVRECEKALSDVEKVVDNLISIDKVSQVRGVIAGIDSALEELRKRLPKKDARLKRMESRGKAIRSKLPVVVQIEGVRNGSMPVDIMPVGNGQEFIKGTSPETKKQCVYWLVRKDELSQGSSRFVRVADADGNVHAMSVLLSDLQPGINRMGITIDQ